MGPEQPVDEVTREGEGQGQVQTAALPESEPGRTLASHGWPVSFAHASEGCSQPETELFLLQSSISKPGLRG